jgi:hypothetical protein
VNVAVTEAAAASVTSHVVASPLHAPDQPVNVEPLAGVAVSVTVAFCVKVPVHVAPHEMPVGDDVIVPSPLPAFVTSSSTTLGVSTTTEPSPTWRSGSSSEQPATTKQHIIQHATIFTARLLCHAV